MNVEVKDIQKSFVFKPRLLFLVLMYVNAMMVESVKSFPDLEANVYVINIVTCKSREIKKFEVFFTHKYTIWTMIQYLLKMILPTYNVTNSDELSFDDTNTMSSDEIWLKLFHIQLAELNRRTDEAQENISKHKKPSQKHSHK